MTMCNDCDYCEGPCKCPVLVFKRPEVPMQQPETVDERLRRAAAEAVRAYIRVMNDTTSTPLQHLFKAYESRATPV